MKGKRKLLYAALAGLLTVFFTGTAVGFNGGPNGNGGGGEASNGTQNQAQNNQCCTGEAMALFGVALESDQTRTRLRECPEEGPNQNPDPGWGPPE
jgi:hypothetical protein